MLKDAWPLTLPQKDIYLDALGPHCGARYNVGGFIELGRIDPDRLADSHARLVSGHEIFGLRILPFGPEVFQKVVPDRSTGLPLIDFSLHNDPESTASCWLAELFGTPLEMEEAELFKAYLLKLGAGRYWYVGIAHHIAFDGWGFSNWARELARLYGTNEPESTAYSWQSVALDEQAYLQGPRYPKDRAFWREQFAGRPQATFSRKTCESGGPISSGRVTATLSVAESELLGSFAAAANVGPSHVLLAALFCHFARYTEMQPVCIGLPFHNRRNAAQKQMLGVFVGVNLLQMRLRRDETCIELAQRVSSTQREVLRHRQYPIGLLVRDLDIRTESKRLYDVGFNYLRFENDLDFGGLPATLHYVPNLHSSTPLMLTAWESTRAEPLKLHLDFCHEYFSEADAARTLRRIRLILGEILAHPQRAVGDVNVVLDDERELLGRLTSGLRAEVPRKSVVDQLQSQIAARPDTVAVRAGSQSMTFRQLGTSLEVVAGRITRILEAAPTRVAICLPRGPALAAALLGVWRIGATVMLLDSSDDVGRTEAMLELGDIQLLVTDPAMFRRFLHTDIPVVLVGPEIIEAGSSQIGHEIVARRTTGRSVAALSWTQEGAGTPRLAEIPHAMLERLVLWARTIYSEAELSRVLASTCLSSSACLFEWVVPLCLGHTVIAGGPVPAGQENSGPTLLHADIPTLERMLTEGRMPHSVLSVSVHGRAPSPKQIKALSKPGAELRLVLAAGGAEQCHCAIASSRVLGPGGVSASTQVRLLDCMVLTRAGDQAPVGWLGELYVTDPTSGGRMSKLRKERDKRRDAHDGLRRRTGLLARVMPDDRIDLVACAGGFVQVNGYLLDLDEIERQAEMVSDVGGADARVVSSPSGEELSLLVACAGKWSPGHSTGRQWLNRVREHLVARLPAYMVPARIEVTELRTLRSRSPVLAGGLAANVEASDHEFAATDMEMEEWLVREWAEISGIRVEDVELETHHLSHGASVHSAIRYANRISTHWQVDLSPADLVDETSIRSLARSIGALLALRNMVEVATKSAFGRAH